MNYPYRKFLAVAKESLQRNFSEAEKVLASINMTMNLDDGFHWAGGYREAVGRCGRYTEGVTFDISVHLRAIYGCIQEEMYDTFPWEDPEQRWERLISESIEDTVFHEMGHGIYRTAREYYDEDDEFHDWCVAEGFDRTVFEDIDEEELCEDYCRQREGSALGRFIEKYSQWDGNPGNTRKNDKRHSA